MKKRPGWSQTLYAIWNPDGGEDRNGYWWQSEGADFGDSPVVFADPNQAEAFASYESWHYHDDSPLQVWDVSDWQNPKFVRLCRMTEPPAEATP